MFQTVIHGRGGQGVVTASELLARAAFRGGAQVQAIPSFGSERMGAPVVAYTRFSDEPILTREPISRPDAVIVQDPTLLTVMNPFEGLVRGGMAVVNTRLSPDQVRALNPAAPKTSGLLSTVPADDIVREYLGRPIPSAALLGAFAALTGQVSLDSVVESIGHQFKGKVASGNIASAQVAYQWVKDHLGQVDVGAPNGIEPVEVDKPSSAELPRIIVSDPEVTHG
ncbi:MAG: 2-oxoacid:acceptor oxidoreductase family protein [Micrococcales bacterium]|nr:2-oxoacid:acceptor oxidoreductase family protein [Micrococcales bacterium]